MSLMLETGAPPKVGQSRAQVRMTPDAARLLERLRAEGGDIALVVAPRLSHEVLCVGRRDFTPGPNDLLIATVRGCPIYLDRREPALVNIPTMVLDVERDLAGLKFVFRPPANAGP